MKCWLYLFMIQISCSLRVVNAGFHWRQELESWIKAASEVVKIENEGQVLKWSHFRLPELELSKLERFYFLLILVTISMLMIQWKLDYCSNMWRAKNKPNKMSISRCIKVEILTLKKDGIVIDFCLLCFCLVLWFLFSLGWKLSNALITATTTVSLSLVKSSLKWDPRTSLTKGKCVEPIM